MKDYDRDYFQARLPTGMHHPIIPKSIMFHDTHRPSLLDSRNSRSRRKFRPLRNLEGSGLPGPVLSQVAVIGGVGKTPESSRGPRLTVQ
jgi:hypothetical protein